MYGQTRMTIPLNIDLKQCCGGQQCARGQRDNNACYSRLFPLILGLYDRIVHDLWRMVGAVLHHSGYCIC